MFPSNLYDILYITDKYNFIYAAHFDWFQNFASMEDKHRISKHTKWTVSELLNDHEKDEHNEQIQKDVMNFMQAFPVNISDLPALEQAFEKPPHNAETLSKDVVDLVQRFLIKHTTAIGVTPFGLQHSSTKALVSVCTLLRNILCIFYFIKI